jgi:predicted Zn-dependent protease
MTLRKIAAFITLLFLSIPSTEAFRLALIRDPEIEEALEKFVEPLLKAADLAPKSVSLYLVQDKSLNAFVAGGANLFVHTGLIEKTRNVNQLLGVLAHEVGHIKCGHLASIDESLKNARNMTLLGMALGAGAAALTGDPSAMLAVGMGTHMSAQRMFLAHTRVQESGADQVALKILKTLGLSPIGLHDFFQILREQTLAPAQHQDPYLLTHPLTEQRMNIVKHAVEETTTKKLSLDPSWDKMHSRMVAKLKAFLNPPQTTFRHFKAENKSLESRYARAIACSLKVDIDNALKYINDLIKDHPHDPFFQEFKGEVLYKNRRIPESIECYSKAVALAPHNALLRVELAQALLVKPTAEQAKKALEHLNFAENKEKENGLLWLLMSRAYASLDNLPMASYALAEKAMAENNVKDAKFHVDRALKGVPKNSRISLRLQDIQSQLKPDSKRKS